jgi:hypothetical protein
MTNNELIKQIDLVPSYENGSWVVREESFRLVGMEAVDIEPTNIWHFRTDGEASAFIDLWRKKKGNI